MANVENGNNEHRAAKQPAARDPATMTVRELVGALTFPAFFAMASGLVTLLVAAAGLGFGAHELLYKYELAEVKQLQKKFEGLERDEEERAQTIDLVRWAELSGPPRVNTILSSIIMGYRWRLGADRALFRRLDKSEYEGPR